MLRPGWEIAMELGCLSREVQEPLEKVHFDNKHLLV